MGESKLSANNFAILGKVQSILQEFPDSPVIVEGHTDATGSAAANQMLSQKRAEAVREYLSSAGHVDESKLSAVGKGFEEPVASNKTRNGRAANRRIDIIISSAAAPSVAE